MRATSRASCGDSNVHITLRVTDVVMRVAQADGESYFRPMIGDLPGEFHSVMMSFVRLIQGCWAEDYVQRPTSRRVLRLMKRLNPFQSVLYLHTICLPSLSQSAHRNNYWSTEPLNSVSSRVCPPVGISVLSKLQPH